MTAPLDLEALDALARWAVDRGNDAGDFGVANAVSGRSLRNLGNGVLALIARVESAETENRYLRDDLEECATTYGIHHRQWNGTHKAIINGTNAELRSWPETVEGFRACWGFIKAFNAENGPFPALSPRDEVAG